MRDILIFAAGLGIGATATFFFVKKHYERVASEEIEAMRDHYISKNDEEEAAEEPENEGLRPSKPSLDELRRKYVSSSEEEDTEAYFQHPEDSDEDEDDYADGYSKEELDSIGYEQREDYEQRKKLSPKIIGVEEYGELPNFDATELIFYQESGRLTDEEDNDIEDENALLGNCMTQFAFEDSDEEDLFVRNFRLATDYHIHKVM